MEYFSNLFKPPFKTTTSRYKSKVSAEVRKGTIGKVQGKLVKKRAEIEKAAFRATDQASGRAKKMQAPGAAGGPQAAPGAPGVPQKGAPGQLAVRQKESAKMGKGGGGVKGKKVKCLGCGQPLNPDWDMCPFCGTPAGEVGGPQPPQPMMGGMPQGGAPQNDGNKTVAINIDELGLDEKRTLVGWIVAQNGNHKGEDFRIFDGKNIIGTAADCDIVITDAYLSAKHCTIRHEGGNFLVTDLDSMNGTFVNQKRCTKADLIDNDTIRLGRTDFKFKSLF